MCVCVCVCVCGIIVGISHGFLVVLLLYVYCSMYIFSYERNWNISWRLWYFEHLDNKQTGHTESAVLNKKYNCIFMFGCQTIFNCRKQIITNIKWGMSLKHLIYVIKSTMVYALGHSARWWDYSCWTKSNTKVNEPISFSCLQFRTSLFKAWLT